MKSSQASSDDQFPAGNVRPPAPEKRIVLLTHEFHPFHGGVATYCRELAQALHREGQPVEVWAPTYSATAPDETIFPFCVRRLPVAGRLTPWDIGRLLLHLAGRSRELAGATLVTASYGSLLAVMLADFLNIRLGGKAICIFHGSEILKLRASPALFRLAGRLLAQPRVSCAAASRYAREQAAQALGRAAKGEVRLLPVAPGSAACQESRASSNHFPDRVRLLTVARVHPRKGQLDVARALARLPEDLKRKVVYRLAGTGDPAYRRLVEDACRRNGISFDCLGEVPEEDLAGLYASCDLFVMTSRLLKKSVEGMGIAYLEAAWHGKPSVGYRTGGVVEAVLDGETGLLVEEGDIPALAGALERLVVDEGLRRRYGENARRFVQSYRWDNTARELIGMVRG